MRTYWVKIVAGAVLIFAVGMIIRSLFRSVKHGVEYVSEGTGPITTPLLFLPFELNGQRVGTFRGLTIYRDSAQKPVWATLTVALRDSATPEDVRRCVVALLPKGSGNNYNLTNYDCLTPSDTGGKGLARFGTLRLRSSSDSFALFAPAVDLEKLRSEWEPKMQSADSAQQFLNDSMRDAIHEQIESTMTAAREKADSLRNTIPRP